MSRVQSGTGPWADPVYSYTYSGCLFTNTEFEVVGSPDPPLDCGRYYWWTGRMFYRQHWARHRVEVQGGLLDVIVRPGTQSHGQASVNRSSGFQLVYLGRDGAVGESFCWHGSLNSTAEAGELVAVGRDVAAANSLTLVASALPAGEPAVLLASSVFQPPTLAFGVGELCLAPPVIVFRNWVGVSASDGRVAFAVDLTALPSSPPHAVLAGETWGFQVAYRDSAGGPTTNLTRGLRIAFQ